MAVKYDDSVYNAIIAAVKESVKQSSDLVLDEVYHLVLETPKTGKIRKHKITGLPHQASAPTESYASETGNALASTYIEFKEDGLEGHVVASAEYAKDLEIGMNRPTLRPAIANKEKETLQTFEKNVKSAVNK